MSRHIVNFRKSELSAGDRKILERWNRHQRNEYTKWEIAEEVCGVILVAVMSVCLFWMCSYL